MGSISSGVDNQPVSDRRPHADLPHCAGDVLYSRTSWRVERSAGNMSARIECRTRGGVRWCQTIVRTELV
jgi:hypothetical protein